MLTGEHWTIQVLRLGGLFVSTTIMAVVLKLLGVLDMPWWWVICPMWLPGVLLSLAVYVAILGGVCWGLLRAYNKRKLIRINNSIKDATPVDDSNSNCVRPKYDA